MVFRPQKRLFDIVITGRGTRAAARLATSEASRFGQTNRALDARVLQQDKVEYVRLFRSCDGAEATKP